MGYKENLKLIDWSVKIDIQAKERDNIPSRRADFPTPMVLGDYEAYDCPVTGKMIEGRAAHNENLKRTGCRLNEPGEFADVKKNGKKNAEAKMDASIDRAVDEIARDYLV